MVKNVKEVLLDDFWVMPATPEYLHNGVPYITSKNIKNLFLGTADMMYLESFCNDL